MAAGHLPGGPPPGLPPPGGRTDPDRARGHLLELGLLLVVEDLREPGVHVLLERVDLLLLLGGEVQPLPEHGRQDLARPVRHRRDRPGRRRGRPVRPGRSRAPREGGQLVLRAAPVLVGVGPVEQAGQPRVGDLGLGQLAVLVLCRTPSSGPRVSASPSLRRPGRRPAAPPPGLCAVAIEGAPGIATTTTPDRRPAIDFLIGYLGDIRVRRE